jgi:uncharacterized membrane protein YkgB
MAKPIRKSMAGTRPPGYQERDHGFAGTAAHSAAAVPADEVVLPQAIAASVTSVANPVGGALLGREGPWDARRISLAAAELARRWFVPAARISIFVIYFWFGLLKIIGQSPATPLASALVDHTIGAQYFGVSFKALAIYECLLGILFLVPAATNVAVVLLLIHMGIVSSPLVLVAGVAWVHPLVPTFEGQYIIKDLALIALAIGILAYTRAGDAAQVARD